MNTFCTIPVAIDGLKKGNMLIVVDSADRENQGDVIFPAENVTTQKVNFMMRECRGMICVPITKMKAIQLDIPLMVEPIDNTEKTKVNFTVSVDAKKVKSFGISAFDRVRTIKVLASSSTKPSDLARPGHVFPIVAANGGVLEREGHTEATIELARLAGFSPCGVLCEIIRDDGKVARLPDLVKFAKKFNLQIISINDLVKYMEAQHKRIPKDSFTVVRKASSLLPTEYGTFQVFVYKSIIDNREHTVLLMSNLEKWPMLTRIHSQCLTGDTFLSLKCDCRMQLHQSMEMIGKKGRGIIIYLNQEGRGIGLSNKIKAYALQDKGLDTVDANHALGLPADPREYEVAAEILKDLGISKIMLLTNNPKKLNKLNDYGINIVEHLPLEIRPNTINKKYLLAKKQKLGHHLTTV